VLRRQREGLSPEELWRAYMQLTEAEAPSASRRRIWNSADLHQKQGTGPRRTSWCVFLPMCVETLAQLCQRARSGQTNPESYSRSLADITLVRCVLPTRNGVTDPKGVASVDHRASGDPAAAPESAPPQLSGNGPNVVKTRGVLPLQTKVFIRLNCGSWVNRARAHSSLLGLFAHSLVQFQNAPLQFPAISCNSRRRVAA